MIIMLRDSEGKFDAITKRIAAAIHAQYPGEIVRECSLVQSFLPISESTKEISLRENNLPITRLTFIGHAHANIFGGFSPDDFVDMMIRELEIATTFDKTFLTSLKTLDLIGCETGFENNTDKSFAQIVSDRLSAEGFVFKVNSFTNRISAEFSSAAGMVVTYPATAPVYNVRLFRNLKNFDNYFEIELKEKTFRKIANSQALKDLWDSLIRLEERWKSQKVDSTTRENELIDLSIYYTQKTEVEDKRSPKSFTDHLKNLLAAINYNNHLENIEISLASADRFLNELLAHLYSFSVVFDSKISEFTAQKKALYETIATTDNPRLYFDTTPLCSFIPNVSELKEVTENLLAQKNLLIDVIDRFNEIFKLHEEDRKEEYYDLSHKLFDYVILLKSKSTLFESKPSLIEKANYVLKLLEKDGIDIQGIGSNIHGMRELVIRLKKHIEIIDKKVLRMESVYSHYTAEAKQTSTLDFDVEKFSKEMIDIIDRYKSLTIPGIFDTYKQAEKNQNIADLTDKTIELTNNLQKNPTAEAAKTGILAIVTELRAMGPAKSFLDCLTEFEQLGNNLTAKVTTLQLSKR